MSRWRRWRVERKIGMVSKAYAGEHGVRARLTWKRRWFGRKGELIGLEIWTPIQAVCSEDKNSDAYGYSIWRKP